MSASHPDIVLCTLNAKYIHAALGLRYLLANMGDLASRTVLREFTIHANRRNWRTSCWPCSLASSAWGSTSGT